MNTLKSTSDAVIEKLLAIINETELGNGGMNVSENNFTAKFDVGGNLKSTLRERSDNLNLDDQKKAAFGNFGQLDSHKEILGNGQISKCPLPGLDYVVFVKGSGPHTIEYDYEIDRPPKEVIVSRKCAEAVLRGAQVMAFFLFCPSLCMHIILLILWFLVFDYNKLLPLNIYIFLFVSNSN